MKPFWKTKSLEEMSPAEWESLCDGCGRCCLNKYEDADTGEILYTDVACKLLDGQSCRCTNYRRRTQIVNDCLLLTPKSVPTMTCLPPTCAYRRIHEGKVLLWWHPLVSGDPKTVHEAGISVRGRCVSEVGLSERAIEARIVSWPQSSRPRAGTKLGRRR